MLSNSDQYIKQNILQTNMVVQSFSIKEIEELIENEINWLTKDINEYQQDYLDNRIKEFINNKIKFKTNITEEQQQNLKKQAGSKKKQEILNKLHSVNIYKKIFDLDLDSENNRDKLKQ